MAGDERFAGVALGAIATGGLLVYAGIKGYSIPATVKALIQGKSPAGQAQVAGLAGTSAITDAATASAGGTASGSAIASDAAKYIGQGYVYGGPSKPGLWDCSSFVSYVLGHDLGLPIPGGSWASVTANGTQHGPASGTYMSFGTSVPLGSAQPGDLVATSEHMGIVTGGGQMISAQDPQLGTGTGNYTSGFPGGTPVCRRV